MRNQHELAESLSPAAERLSELARSELGTMSPHQRSAGLRALQRRLEQQKRPHYLAPRLVLASVALAALLAFGVGRFVLGPDEATALKYVIDGKPPSAELIEAAEQPKLLRFSDGTEVAVAPLGRARVHSIDRRGAQLAIDSGKLSLHVTPRRSSEWAVAAGPFLIRVTGTRFTTEWQPAEQRLEVRLEHGSVLVSGPLSDEPIRLRAGQMLSVRLREREVVIRELEVPLAKVEPVPRVDPAPAQVAQPLPAEPRVSPRPSASAASLSWTSELSAGNFEAILKDAKARGIDRVLSSAGSEELAALADAARFRREPALARRALGAQRERFASSSRARDAAFLLGRLEEANGAPQRALSWYDVYLAEAARGTYASEALGRKMLVVQSLHGKQRAAEVAREYLRRFPTGAYAQTARALDQSN
jgi:hypothetical protein